MSTEDDVRAERALRMKFLHAAYHRERAGEDRPGADKIAGEIGMAPDDWPAIKRVTQALEGDGLLEGFRAHGAGLVRVKLTPAGRRLVESKIAGTEPPGGFPASVGDVRIDGSGNIVNIQQHSPDATQHVVMTPFDQRRLSTLLDDLDVRASVHGLTEDDLADVKEQSTLLREEVGQARPDTSKVRSAVKLLIRILKTAEGSLATLGLVEGFQGFLDGLN
jgi:hypothetical protein